jgi:carbon storage regulator
VLVLSRKQNEEILIGENVCIKVVSVSGNNVRLGISAPRYIAIQRAELDFLGQTSDRLPVINNLQTLDINFAPHGNCVLEPS